MLRIDPLHATIELQRPKCLVAGILQQERSKPRRFEQRENGSGIVELMFTRQSGKLQFVQFVRPALPRPLRAVGAPVVVAAECPQVRIYRIWHDRESTAACPVTQTPRVFRHA